MLYELEFPLGLGLLFLGACPPVRGERGKNLSRERGGWDRVFESDSLEGFLIHAPAVQRHRKATLAGNTINRINGYRR